MAEVPGDVERGSQKSGKTSVDTKYVHASDIRAASRRKETDS